VCFYVLLGFVFAVVDLSDFFLQLLEESVGMAFGVFFTCAKSIDYIIIIVSDMPNSIGRFEFIAFIGLGSEGFGFLRELNGKDVTLSMSADSDLLESYLMML